MSRKDTLNALFGPRIGMGLLAAPETKSVDGAELGAPNTGPAQVAVPAQVPPERVRAGAVGAMGLSLRDIAREADEMRLRMANGEQVLEIDPVLIDPAPFADRLVIEVDPDFKGLVASIRDSGQQVPALVRPHPSKLGRFQTAYGHRRVRACQALGRPVRAVVRALDDAALAVAQGQENIARRDLSFIEKAVFAAGLEASGLPRSTILQAIATEKGDLSRYIAVARAVPVELARAIGPAPKAGRARWLGLVEALAAAGWASTGPPGLLPGRVQATLEKSAFAASDSDARLAMVMAALRPKKAALPPPQPLDLTDGQGRLIGRLTFGRSPPGSAQPRRTAATITIAGDDPPGFASFLATEIPDLHSRWKASVAEAPAMQDLEDRPETRGE